MPKDYVACVENYVKKGVSKKTAKARCAAWFYKKHGYTVNEAHEKGWATAPDIEGIDRNDLDYDLVEKIMSNLSDLSNVESVSPKEVKLTKKEEKQDIELTEQAKTTVISTVDMLDDFNIVEIIATKVGAKAFTASGTVVIWSERGLVAAEKTWVGKPVTANHDGKKAYGIIISSFLDGNDLRMVLKVDDFIKDWIKAAGSLMGVSIEGVGVKIKDFEIISAIGSGVTFVFPPEEPGCSIEEGCGIVATETKEENKTDEIAADISQTACTETKITSDVIQSANSWIASLPTAYYIGTNGEQTVYDWYTTPNVDWEKYKIIIQPVTLDNNNEKNINSEKPENGDKMSEDVKKEETICAKKHETLMKEKDAQIEALNKELESLRATVSKYDEEKKNVVLESIKLEGVDVEPYKNDPIQTLEKLLNAVKAYKVKVASSQVVDSGAVVKATETVTDPDGDALRKAKEEADAKIKAVAEAEMAKIKEIDEKAKKLGY